MELDDRLTNLVKSRYFVEHVQRRIESLSMKKKNGHSMVQIVLNISRIIILGKKKLRMHSFYKKSIAYS